MDEMKTAAPKRLKPGGSRPLVILGIAAAVLLAAFLGLCAYAGSLDTFYPNSAINGVAVGGMTAEQAQAALETQLPARLCEIYLDCGDTPSPETREPDAAATFAELGISPEAGYEGAVRASYILQHGKGFLSGGFTYLRALLGKNTCTSGLFTWDSRQLDRAVETLLAELNTAPRDTAYVLKGDSIQITTAVDGRQIPANELRRAIQNTAQASSRETEVVELPAKVLPARVLTAREIRDAVSGPAQNAGYDARTGSIIPERPSAEFDADAAQAALDSAAPGETVTLPADIHLPSVTAEALKTVLFRDVLGQARTKVGGTAARKANVRLSAASINGYVMNTGDVFSYNGVVGKRTAANGYQPAPAYVKGETVDEIGGGICQTSSTLYLACLRSNLEITERYAHRYIPAYIAAGMDATVSWGGPDYKFTNNTDYPIQIVTSYEGGYLTIKLLGTNVTGITAKMTNESLSSTPFEVVYEEDPTLAPGTEKVKTTPYTGSKWKTYRHLYDASGKRISSAYEATSDYKSRNKVILRGPALDASAQPEIPVSGQEGLPAESGGAEAPVPPIPQEPEPPVIVLDPQAPAA